MTIRHVLIDTTVMEMVEGATENCSGQPETGGILLGSLRGPHIECTGFSEAGPDDRRGSLHFTRQDSIHQKIASHAWNISGHTVTFIGEWHTHPIGNPTPSSIDTASWCALAQRAKHSMVFLIAAPSAWQGFLVAPGTKYASIHPLSIFECGQSGIVLN